jgi:mannosyltransferase OCH1-like enzyme
VIPRILHRVVPLEVPPLFDEWWGQWKALHRGWGYATWRDPLNPDEWELGPLFERCATGAQLAGLVRLEAVWRMGGVYVDMDMEPQLPIDDLLDNACFIGTEDGAILTDAMFGATRNHPGIRACMDRLLNGYWSDNPSDTGPRLTTDVLRGRSDVTVLDREAFYPYSWEEPHLAAEAFPNSYAIHRWNHSWKDWQA